MTVSPRTIYPPEYNLYYGPRHLQSRVWIIPSDIRGVIIQYLAKSMLKLLEEAEQSFTSRVDAAFYLAGRKFWHSTTRIPPTHTTFLELLPVYPEEYFDTLNKIHDLHQAVIPYIEDGIIETQIRKQIREITYFEEELEKINSVKSRALNFLRGSHANLEFNRSRFESALKNKKNKLNDLNLFKVEVKIVVKFLVEMRLKVLSNFIDGLFYPYTQLDLPQLKDPQSHITKNLGDETILISSEFSGRCIQLMDKPLMRMSENKADYIFIAIQVSRFFRVLVLGRSHDNWNLLNNFISNSLNGSAEKWRCDLTKSPAFYNALQLIIRSVVIKKCNSDNQDISLLNQTELNDIKNKILARQNLPKALF